MSKQIIIIPDIHGRSFWREAVEKYPEDEYVFLGDYLDPYPYEGITDEEVQRNFNDIMNFRHQHPKQVTLLLGNHDLMMCKMPVGVPGIIFEVFHDLFQVACVKRDARHTFVMSHAGISLPWAARPDVQEVLGTDPHDIEAIAGRLNELWRSGDERLYRILDQIGKARGGDCEHGSPVWADLDEWDAERTDYPGYVQVFGHTQQEKDPVVCPYWMDLDCRRAFAMRLVDER